MQTTATSLNFSSFRDPEGHVFKKDGAIYRVFAPAALPRLQKLLAQPFFKDLTERGHIIPTQLVPSAEAASSFLLHHETVPVVTFPYEWSFEMLKDAALGQLHILKDCLNHGFILKDGSSFNSTYYKGKMVFLDVLSIADYQEGQVWAGYNQFCREFLFPLMLRAYKGITVQEWLRGTLGEIKIDHMKALITMRDWVRPGIFKHVVLQSKLEKMFASQTITQASNQNLFSKASLLKLVDQLFELVQSLKLSTNPTLWSDYQENNSYNSQDHEQKQTLVQQWLTQLAPKNLIDLGGNTGEYSIIAANHAHQVVSIDLDEMCTDKLYQYIRSNDHLKHIFPLTSNLMNPSSAKGWMNQERASLFERVSSDTFLALALMHHLCIGANVPLEHFLIFLQRIAPQGILEWVDRSDPMIQFMLRNREDIFANYTWESFLPLLNKYFTVKDVQTLRGGTRKLCLLTQRQSILKT